ncbi:MAG: component of SufBCD complex [Paracoccaceae bacterium]
MDWVQIIFELIDLRSFSNLWYWIGLAVLWSSASHWVIGVPFDMISRARREGGEALADLETMVRINTTRTLFIARTAGLMLVAVLCFVITTLGILAVWYGIEFAQAVLLMLVPVSILGALTLRTAHLIAAGENTGDALFRRLGRHRLSTQVLGMVAIFVTAMFGMYQNIQIGMPG